MRLRAYYCITNLLTWRSRRLLARHPHVLSKLREEIEDKVGPLAGLEDDIQAQDEEQEDADDDDIDADRSNVTLISRQSVALGSAASAARTRRTHHSADIGRGVSVRNGQRCGGKCCHATANGEMHAL